MSFRLVPSITDCEIKNNPCSEIDVSGKTQSLKKIIFNFDILDIEERLKVMDDETLSSLKNHLKRINLTIEKVQIERDG